MACNRLYKTRKTQVDNDYFLGSDRAPQIVVEAKRVLQDCIVLQHSLGGDAICVEDGVVFAEARPEYKKNAQCYGCGRKGHLLC